MEPGKEDEDGSRRRQLEESLAADPDDPSLHFDLGMLLWENGGEAAAEHFLLSAKLNPQNGDAFRYLGHYYAGVSGDVHRALKCYQRAVALNPDDSLAGEPFCDLLDRQGNLTLQLSVCTQASDESSTAYWAFRRLGFLLVHHNRWSDAVHRLQHAIRGYTTSADLWEALGLAYHRLGMFTAAIKSYGKAIELEDSRIFALIQSGNVSFMLGSFRKGIEYFKQALEISPQNIAANYGFASSVLGLAKECVDSGAYKWGASLLEESSEVLLKMMSLTGNISSLWKLHGDIQLLYAKSFPWLGDPLSLEADDKSFDDSIITWKKTCYLAAGSASRSYQRALHLVPWQANLYADVAVASDLILSSLETNEEDLSSWSKSEKMCIGGLLLEGDTADFWVTLGCLSDHYALKQHALIRGLQLDVSLAVAWAYAGKLYRKEGKKQLAQQAFDRARSIDPTLGLPWAGMSADADVRNMKPDEAYECCLRSVQITPIAEFQVGLAKLAFYSSHLPSSEVFGAIKQAVHRAPHYPETHNLNGLVCEARGDHKSAVDSFRLARHAVNSFIGGESGTYLKAISINLARSFCKAGNPSEAVQECERLKIDGLLDMEGWHIYAFSLWQLGQNDIALSAIRKLAGSILSLDPCIAAVSVVFITRVMYHILGQELVSMNVLKMPRELFQSSRVCFVISALHVLDPRYQLEPLVSFSRRSLVSSEEISSMHSLIALGKIVKHGSRNSLGIHNGIDHLRKALHMYPNSELLRNFLGYLLLSRKEWNDGHLAARCSALNHGKHQKDRVPRSAIEILGAGAVACYAMVKSPDKYLSSSCEGEYFSGTRAIQHLQICVHQEPWNYQARYLLILNYLQKARKEKFPHHLCSTLERLISATISENVGVTQEKSYEYQKFQLLLCAAEVRLQVGDHIGCVKNAVRASNLKLSDSHLFHAHLLLCRAYAAEDNLVDLNREYMRCLELKGDCHVGWIILKIIHAKYKIQTEDTVLAVGFENCSREVKGTWNMWMAVFQLVQGLLAIQTNDYLGAEDILAQACSLAGDESCIFLCHGIVCMELARQMCDSRFLSTAVQSLKKARDSPSPLPMVSLLLAQAEGSLGSRVEWKKTLQNEWFPWPTEAKPAEVYFQMHLLLSSKPQSAVRLILQAIHLNPSSLRYWNALKKVTDQGLITS